MGGGFTWLVALRYLRMRAPRTNRIHVLTAILLVLLLAVVAASWAIDHSHMAALQDWRAQYAGTLRLAKVGALVGFVLIEAFILLVRRLTIFTTISTYGLFLGSGALVIVLSVMSGFEADLRHKILGANAHIVVQTPDRPFTDYEAVAKKLATVPDLVGVSPFISNEVMISSSSNLSGVVLKGIDIATVEKVTDLGKQIETGSLEYLDHPEKLLTLPPAFPKDEDDEEEIKPPKDALKLDPGAEQHLLKPPPKDAPEQRRVIPGVIIGRELAKNLRLYPADDVNIVSPMGGIGPSGPIPKSKPFRVAGIFFSGMFEYDSKKIYMSIPAAQKFLSMDGEITGFELKVHDPDDTEGTVAQLKTLLGPGYDVQDWKELNRNLFSALKLEKIAMFIVLCFIILVAAFSIIANGIMLVMEKGREIAILKSMGATDSAVLVIFILLGLYIGALGTITGISIGIFACLALSQWGLSLDPDVYYITQLPVRLNPYEIGAVLAAGLTIAVLATLYPAWAAARLKPVEGLSR
jgi:lipoprotein-releasing system permease protein